MIVLAFFAGNPDLIVETRPWSSDEAAEAAAGAVVAAPDSEASDWE